MPNQSLSHQRHHASSSKSKALGKVWLFFVYYWIIFGVGCFFGQFLPLEWRRPLSIGLMALILISLFINRSRKFGFIISNIYALGIGLLSYASFTVYLQNLGPEVFYKNIILAVSAFIIFGLLGYFVIGDAKSMGKYLFVTLIALIIASIIGWFIQNSFFHTIIVIVGLMLFLLYTLYDFNRMKHGRFSPREMGFNLFLNLVHIIKDILYLANKYKK
ncbi:Bax inhibitor-1/YccA family protein [Staphylococcus massiliensis]|uniref:Uncharacterized protein n=1 Tax=Staphylococcus massiliensis S46 TaxID=1229783 RepID=K9AMQ7_9STAP|nr:Bax inhibitor-1 family protein [Staphylococcus massiliensis]EKU48609.1 hypothetical protein C273_05360 [Staphylococcus massiliensis S46]MCG3400255.1 Bax inhibitor-1 family protein [Staphylococcus massiliensis]MCG3401885.1 Bax inhibitor-1 family protein [Staphylococcus massiliensis]MCG3413138.1 Bax inhibitor-1 family protein [Staphylococcus massiliensis]PNZ98450.1 hypothetical protein CD133_08555 [Staphylococcus massiliensis CCUG 55927]